MANRSPLAARTAAQSGAGINETHATATTPFSIAAVGTTTAAAAAAAATATAAPATATTTAERRILPVATTFVVRRGMRGMLTQPRFGRTLISPRRMTAMLAAARDRELARLRSDRLRQEAIARARALVMQQACAEAKMRGEWWTRYHHENRLNFAAIEPRRQW